MARKGSEIYCLTNHKKYKSAYLAAQDLNISKSAIYRVLSGKYKSASGYVFRYANINTEEKSRDINDINYIEKLKLKIRQLEDKNKILEQQILKHTKNKLYTSDKEQPKIIKELDYNGMRYD